MIAIQPSPFLIATRRFIVAFLSLLAMATSVRAGDRIAVFDLELVRGADNFADAERLAADEARLAMASQRLRQLFRDAGRFELADIGPVVAKAKAVHLQSCGNCAAGFARDVGAALAVTGEVHKTSELIISLHVYVHDAATEQPITAAAVDIRGNTDESWRRGIDYLFRNALMPRLDRALK
jgi:Protein of unknown function (DUF2380)